MSESGYFKVFAAPVQPRTRPEPDYPGDRAAIQRAHQEAAARAESDARLMRQHQSLKKRPYFDE